MVSLKEPHNMVPLNQRNANGATMVPELLRKIANGSTIKLNRQEIYEYNVPNYSMQDILVERIEMEIYPFDPIENHNHVMTKGTCVDFQKAVEKGSSFPELRWEHMTATPLNVIINQIGKVSHNVCSEGRNGIALRTMNINFRRHALMTSEITFEYESEIYERRSEVWANSRWKFFSDDKKFVDFSIVSRGIVRDYSSVEANMRKASTVIDFSYNSPIGDKMVAINALTPWQRESILDEQKEMKDTGKIILFGELAVKKGYCTQKHVEQCINS